MCRSIRARRSTAGCYRSIRTARCWRRRKTFFRWGVMEKKWLARNPLDVVKGIGKVRHGKAESARLGGNARATQN